MLAVVHCHNSSLTSSTAGGQFNRRRSLLENHCRALSRSARAWRAGAGAAAASLLPQQLAPSALKFATSVSDHPRSPHQESR